MLSKRGAEILEVCHLEVAMKLGQFSEIPTGRNGIGPCARSSSHAPMVTKSLIASSSLIDELELCALDELGALGALGALYELVLECYMEFIDR